MVEGVLMIKSNASNLIIYLLLTIFLTMVLGCSGVGELSPEIPISENGQNAADDSSHRLLGFWIIEVNLDGSI